MSQILLEGLYPPLAERCRQVALDAEKASVKTVWTSGLRSFADQDTLWRKGRDLSGNVVDPRKVVTNARAGYSWHNMGLAADFGLLRPDGKTLEWSDVADLDHDGLVDWVEVGKLAESHGLEWGGGWSKFRDFPHVQWPCPVEIEDIRRVYIEQGLPAVWALMDAAGP